MKLNKENEKQLKQISENVDKSKKYILSKVEKFSQVGTACDLLQEMIPS